MNEYRIKLVKLLLLIMALLAFSGGYYEYRAGNLSATLLRETFASTGVWGPVAFVALYALMAGFGLPAVIATAAGALLYGKWLGTALNVAGAVAGASIAFGLSRFVARDFVSARIKNFGWYVGFSDGIRENGFYYILFIRLVPLFPFNGVNFACGVTELTFRQYFWATLLGIVPATFVFTNAAAEAGELAERGFRLTPGLVFALVLFALLALIPPAAKRVMDRRRAVGRK